MTDTRIRFFHTRHVDLLPLTDEEKEQYKLYQDNPEGEAPFAVVGVIQASTGKKVNYRRHTVEETLGMTETSVPEGFFTAGVNPRRDFINFLDSLEERNCSGADIYAVSVDNDPTLAKRIAAELNAEVIDWEDDPENTSSPVLSTGEPNPRWVRFLEWLSRNPTAMTMLFSVAMVLYAFSLKFQLRTTVGRDFTSDSMHANTASRPTTAQIIALAQNGAAPAVGQTVMGGGTGNELTADGFARATAAYTHTSSTQTSTLQKTFTHTASAGAGTPRTINLVAVFGQANGGTIPGAADSGIMVFINSEPSPPTLTGTDSLDQRVTIDFGS